MAMTSRPRSEAAAAESGSPTRDCRPILGRS
jgi:hypothetical protein